MSQPQATFSIDVSHVEDHLRIALAGALDADRAQLLGQMLATAVECDEKSVIIDLRDVDTIDASGVTVLVSADRLLRRSGGSVVAVDPSPAVEAMIQAFQRRPVVPILGTQSPNDRMFGAPQLI